VVTAVIIIAGLAALVLGAVALVRPMSVWSVF
jgi:hypothetical protein